MNHVHCDYWVIRERVSRVRRVCERETEREREREPSMLSALFFVVGRASLLGMR